MKRYDFNTNWRFCKEGGQARAIDLPHDAMIEERRDPASPGGSGVAYFPGGVYIYEKIFTAPPDWMNTQIVFQFEGVYRNATVFINGKVAGGQPYGYIPFFVEVSRFLNYGGENTIRVVADNSRLPNSRWYSGSGIYRPVWLWQGSKTHIDIEGVKISTLSYSPARIKIEVSHTGGVVSVIILRDGTLVASGTGDCITLDIPNAKLWSDETPELYQCSVTLADHSVVVDEVTENFGIRLIEWSTKGLFINGTETLLRGGCIHHDNGILGARSYAESEERRIRILKQAGFNAIRSAHNPASPWLLEACDKYGLYVMDETWDMWYEHKNKYDYASDFMENYKTDIKAIIQRDFNHPSIIMYSIGNEVSEPYNQKGVDLAGEMVNYVHSLDKTRAVTCGINFVLMLLASMGKGIYKEAVEPPKSKKKEEQPAVGSTLFNLMTSIAGSSRTRAAQSKRVDRLTSPGLDVLDVAGYNYASSRYSLEGKAHPRRIIVGSETFPQDIAKNWAMVKKYPYLIGDFMWTAFDYLGEAGLGAWTYTPDGGTFNKPYPWLLAEAGAIDILGNVGAEAEYAGVVWGLRDKPYIGVQPVNHPGVKPAKGVWRGTNAMASWAWKDCEGNKAVVEVYIDADSVLLILNEKPVGRKKIKKFRAIFKVKYEPGILTAVAYDKNGVELSRASLVSATEAVNISVKPEKNTVTAREIVYVDIGLCDKSGVVESNADALLSVTVDGGELLAFGSANPCTEENYLSGSFTTYYGKAQAVVKAYKVGPMRITVNGGGLNPSFAEINVVE
jgi:hypothetical protein